MKLFLDFWKKDIINKLIVIVLLGLVGAVFAFGWLIFSLPQGRSLTKAFADLLPQQATPTFDVNSYLTPATNIPGVVSTANERPTLQPTYAIPSPAPKVELPIPTLELLPTPTRELPAQPLPTPTQAVSNGSACIPNNPHQTGRVLEVVDGNTVRILIKDNGLVYVIRYIGIVSPVDKKISVVAKQKNTDLVYGKEVVLIKDVNDKDDRGRLLRYVMVGDTFVNFEMIKQGLGTALDVPPDSACAQTFQQVEQSASGSLLGVWSPTATPSSP
jgi:endonuclease YncB( thermonuclease family)